ncbi:TPA: cation transporter [Acinetobacter baumannii]|uniref:cation efflux protein, CzcI-like n=1 Tax=Acinetobacter baumannii TaxID=470 RepID=UPI0022ACC2C6|nr:cation transporter [Acinetobacter baumannii]HCV3126194.1 cation transporter [Acinetobacter baumannii]
MPRSAIFMSVLFCLLIFQSLWNIAAAFCAHENQEKALHHFGHHAALNVYQTSSHTHVEHTETLDAAHKAPLNLQDHHDHLPTCFHVVMTEVTKQAQTPVLHVHELSQIYHWSNSYQSPHLSALKPPPVLTPL